MIPQIIHLCRLSGDSYSPKIDECLETSKIHLSDFKSILWGYLVKVFDCNLIRKVEVALMPWKF